MSHHVRSHGVWDKAHLKTFYSEVDVRIAKGFIDAYKTTVEESKSPSM